ncbi:MAG: hypothetical protein U0359_12065 [Byssovorax sp.]
MSCQRAPALSFTVLAAVALAALTPAPARACAVCGAGDPTLTVAGTERPFDGRFRVSGLVRLGSVRSGAPGVDEASIAERRLDLGLAYAPIRTLFLSLALPALQRDALFQRGERRSYLSLGDIELRAKYFAWQDRRGLFFHQFAVLGGVKLPTSPLQRGPDGAALPDNLQPGMGAVTPLAGAAYAMTRGPYSLFASAAIYLPFAVREGPHGGDSLRSSFAAQLQPMRVFAARLGVDTRLDTSADRDGKPDPDTGGFIGYLKPELVLSPVTDLVFQVSATFPVIQALHGNHHEGSILALGVSYDL